MAMSKLAFNTKWNKWRTPHIAWSSATSMRQSLIIFRWLMIRFYVISRFKSHIPNLIHLQLQLWTKCQKTNDLQQFICWHSVSGSHLCEYRKKSSLRNSAYDRENCNHKNSCTLLIFNKSEMRRCHQKNISNRTHSKSIYGKSMGKRICLMINQKKEIKLISIILWKLILFFILYE